MPDDRRGEKEKIEAGEDDLAMVLLIILAVLLASHII